MLIITLCILLVNDRIDFVIPFKKNVKYTLYIVNYIINIDF